MHELEMIAAIVNKGYSGTVMDAARKAGARGGTVIKARGTADLESEKLFSMVIEPEKDLILLVVPVSIRNSVLTAIYEAAGTATAAQGIVFALPVEKAVGINSGK